MKLCGHLQPIYAEEIRKGNTVACVFAPENTSCDIVIQMRQVLPDSEPCSDIRAEKPPRNSPYDAPEIQYRCRKCRGMIFSYYDVSEDCLDDKPSPRAIATPKNVYCEDGYHFGWLRPTVISEAQRLEIEAYWAAHPEEKEKLNRERREWCDKERTANHARFDLDVEVSKKTGEIKEKIQKLNPYNPFSRAKRIRLEKQAAAVKDADKDDLDRFAEEMRIANQHIDETSRKLVLGYGWDDFPENKQD